MSRSLYRKVSSITEFNLSCEFTGIHKPNLILDLDNTLICSLSFKDELSKVPQDYQEKFIYIDMKPHYRIFERPHLQLFLDYIFMNFNVSIFTAADKNYAIYIIDKIVLQDKPERKISCIFFGYHTGLSETYYQSPKDLRLLWNTFKLHNFLPCNTLIIDDLPDVYEANPRNTIKAPKFELLKEETDPVTLQTKYTVDYTAINDTFMLSVVDELEKWRLSYSTQACRWTDI